MKGSKKVRDAKQAAPVLAEKSREKTGSANSFFSLKSLVLTALFLFVLVVITHIQSYSDFYVHRIQGGYEDISKIKEMDNYMDVEVRRSFRWGRGYQILKELKKGLKSEPNAIVMVPPILFAKAINAKMELPEPAVSYYYTGLKTAWGKTNYVYKSTHAYVVTPKGASIIDVPTRGKIDSLLEVYKAYPY